MLVFSAINLGCTKNLVDTQYLLGKVFSDSNANVESLYCPDPYDDEVELVFLNTCGFIKSGRDEMFATIEELRAAGKRVCVLGCALQYFQGKLKIKNEKLKNIASLRDVEEWSDRQRLLQDEGVQFLSRGDIEKVSIGELFGGYRSSDFPGFSFPKFPRAYTNIDQGFEYLKIAEGCNNACSFCIIPQIRGTQVSQPIDTILHEVRDLVAQGVKEIILIAQDTTRYGIDLSDKGKVKSNKEGSFGLIQLLKEIDQIEGEFVYRLLYLYPDIMTMQWFDEMSKLKKFVPYFDLPLQHINTDLLKSMKRFSDVDRIRQLLTKIRESFTESYIRTNFIIGFPGEREEHVDELMAFISEGYFDSIAVFEYHNEPLASSSAFENQVPAKLIRQRFRRVTQLVDSIIDEKIIQRKKVFSTNKGYVHGTKNGKILLRPWIFAPEIDPMDEVSLSQIIKNISGHKELQIGDLVLYRN